MSFHIAIIVVGYNRVTSLLRLLDSIESSYYDVDNVDLIISLDKSENHEVYDKANAFVWTHGLKDVVLQSERLGLRKHILKCGEYLKRYDAIIVLEDDIVVSKWFFKYAVQAFDYYHNDERIAGISLYNYNWNEFANMPFEPMYSEYSTYFIQLAQSWGQIWLRNQWDEFTQWLENFGEGQIEGDDIPYQVACWKSTSWKKYHIKYCVEKNKYFVQPYMSLATCFSEVGQHCQRQMTMLQTQLYDGKHLYLRFANFVDPGAIKYDVFFERVFSDIDDVGFRPKDSCIDLYGTKSNYSNYRYVFSTKSLPYKIIKKLGLQLKPHEANIIHMIPGNDIYLYDTSIKDTFKKINKNSIFVYHFNIYDHTSDFVRCIVESFKIRFIESVHKIFRI